MQPANEEKDLLLQVFFIRVQPESIFTTLHAGANALCSNENIVQALG